MKYKNKKKEIDGILFDSTMEADYYIHLKKEQEQGHITDLQLQPVFLLQPAFKKLGKTIRKMEYKADFDVTYSGGARVIVDVKGVLTQAFKLKAKLFDYYHPDLELRLITQHNGQWIEVKNKPKSKKGRTRKKSGGVRRGKNVQI